MPSRVSAFSVAALVLPALFFIGAHATTPANPAGSVFGYHDFAAEQAGVDRTFLAVPDAKLAGEELKTLTAEPHIAASPEDHKTAEYVAQKFREAGLETTIVPYKAWLNMPKSVKVEAWDGDGKLLMTGPVPEHVDGNEPFQSDSRVTPAFNGSSPSGDVTGTAVYANYCRPEDFQKLKEMNIDVKGDIVVCRYGGNFRGVKVYVAQEHGAAGVIIYSDPADDGYYRGDMYPHGPYRPATAVQRGSVQYMFKYPGDALTPGVASRPDLAESQRLPLDKVTSLPTIPSEPLSYHDAAPILEHIGGPAAPREWQGALPFTYHVGPGVKVHLDLKMDYEYSTIWDVVGTVAGAEFPMSGSWRAITATRGCMAPSIPTAARQRCWKPCTALALCSGQAGSRSGGLSSVRGTRKKRA